MPQITAIAGKRAGTAKARAISVDDSIAGIGGIIKSHTITPGQSVFDQLPESAFVREAQLVQSAKRPDIPAPLPFSAPTLWRKVAQGTFPKPLKLSARVTCWKVSQVRQWMREQAEQGYIADGKRPRKQAATVAA
jgi:prophage regulatory protein